MRLLICLARVGNSGQRIMGNEVLDGVAVVWDGVHSVGAPTDDRDTLGISQTEGCILRRLHL